MDPQAVVEVFRRNVTQHYFDMKGRVRRRNSGTLCLPVSSLMSFPSFLNISFDAES